MDAEGIPVWVTNGVAICTDPRNQASPWIVSDGQGGAIILWEDVRTGDRDIYAQRVDASGNVLWTANGVPVCTAADIQMNIEAVSDGMGGAIVTWEDSRSGTNFDIYAQRIDSTGGLVWFGDEAVCTDSSDQRDPTLTADGKGGAVIAWIDWRNGNGDIYAQRIASDGSRKWTPDGIPICTAPNDQSGIGITLDATGAVVIVWSDRRNDFDYDIYAQRVSLGGDILWPSDGIQVSQAPGNEYAMVVSDGCGGTIITRSDLTTDDTDIYAQRVDSSGALLWGPSGVAVTRAGGDQLWICVVSDELGGIIAAWADLRTGYYGDVYAQRIERNGYWGYPAPTIHGVRDVPGDQGGFVDLAWDASRLDPWPNQLISYYTVWRAIDPGSASTLLRQGYRLVETPSCVSMTTEPGVIRLQHLLGLTYYCELVSTVDAYYLESYSSAVPTLFDSTSVCSEHHYFQVIAHGSSPEAYWISQPDSGRSVDNLSPSTPQGLKGEYDAGTSQLILTWKPNTEDDLSHYAVYKGTSADFMPDESNRLGQPADTLFVDSAFDPGVSNYYKVSAWDIHENESGYAVLSPEDITGVVPPVVKATRLEQNAPNPFSHETVIRFSLAKPCLVDLTVYDVSGRPVRTLCRRWMEAGRHELKWDGTDDEGRSLAPGIYLYRLKTPNYTATRKILPLSGVGAKKLHL